MSRRHGSVAASRPANCPSTRRAWRRRLAAACAAAVLLLTGSACGEEAGDGRYFVPARMWKVELVPAQHLGEPFLRVTIADDFRWPEPAGEPPEPINYRITLRRPGEEPIREAARLTESERIALVFVPSPRLAGDLNLDEEGDRRRIEDRTARAERAIEALGGEGQAVPEDAVERVEAIRRDFGHGIEADLDDRAAVAEHQLELVPFAGDRALARQEGGGKTADPPKYRWGTEVTDDADRCKGKTPEACVRERLRRLRDRLCDAKKEGAPRFPRECELLRRLLAKDPPEPKLECVIPAETGVTSGETDPITQLITLNGEDLLTSPCGESVVLHELSHALDFQDPNAYPNLKKLRDAENRKRKAQEDLRAAKAAGDEAAAKRARQDLAKAFLDEGAVEQEAGAELIQTEHNALFAVLDNSDLFGYPGEGRAWVKEEVKGMVGELANIRRKFNLAFGSPAVKGPLCSCFRRIRDWVNGRADIKENFEKEVFSKEARASWIDAIEGLTGRYCG